MILCQLILSAYLSGVIVIVQFLVYPQFRTITEADFASYHSAHTRRMAWIVGPAMLLELLFAIVAVAQHSHLLSLLLLSSVVIIWLATGLVHVPQHRKLGVGKSIGVIDQLVATNWLRTFLWPARTVTLWFVAIAQPNLI